MVAISSWGRLSQEQHKVIALNDHAQVAEQLNQASSSLAYGMGRSYGDVCLNPEGELWLTQGMNRFIEFDASTGLLTCEAGVLLYDIQRYFVPRGWILPVTPGTQMITVGGAIANDVHGKNHHVCGTFGEHVHQIKLVRTNGEIIECGPQEKKDWFSATVGGLGLTGIIVKATIKLKRVPSEWLNTETIPYSNLKEFFALSDDSESNWEHTVSWVDCVSTKGRGLFMRGNPTQANRASNVKNSSFTVPFVPPVSLVNRLSLKLFNTAYYQLKKLKPSSSITHYQPFFYPLDNLLEWNRMYGPKGFFQYQCVIPPDVGMEAVQAMLNEISRTGEGSFLAVLKTFGNRQSIGMMSFPKPGVTLALDFPNQGSRTHKLFANLDAIVKETGGRIYLAKDARQPRELFEAGYPRLDEFINYRDPGISSAMSRRLMGH